MSQITCDCGNILPADRDQVHSAVCPACRQVFVPEAIQERLDHPLPSRTCQHCSWWGCSYEGVCDFEGTLFAEGPKGMQIKVTVADDHGLTAHLVTGPDFGCVQFEAKTSEAEEDE